LQYKQAIIAKYKAPRAHCEQILNAIQWKPRSQHQPYNGRTVVHSSSAKQLVLSHSSL